MTIPIISDERLSACHTVIFDFDGTLCDSAGDIQKAFHDSAVACGYDPATLGEIPVGPPLVESLLAGLGRSIDDAALEKLVATYRECYIGSDFLLSPPYPGALELLQRLKASGKHIALATNKSERGTARMLELKEITALFDIVLCHDSGGEFWSKERMIETILQRTQTPKENAIFFGDAPTDVAAGKNVGLPTVAALYGYGDRDELLAANPDFVCPNLAEVTVSFHHRGLEEPRREKNEQQPEAPAISVKPTWFDFVLDGIVILLLLTLWIIALGSFIFPDAYSRTGDLFFVIVTSIFVMYDIWINHSPRQMARGFFVKITKENAERQYRLESRAGNYILIFVLASIIQNQAQNVIPLSNIAAKCDAFSRPGWFLGITLCLFLWYIIRARMLK